MNKMNFVELEGCCGDMDVLIYVTIVHLTRAIVQVYPGQAPEHGDDATR